MGGIASPLCVVRTDDLVASPPCSLCAGVVWVAVSEGNCGGRGPVCGGLGGRHARHGALRGGQRGTPATGTIHRRAREREWRWRRWGGGRKGAPLGSLPSSAAVMVGAPCDRMTFLGSLLQAELQHTHPSFTSLLTSCCTGVVVVDADRGRDPFSSPPILCTSFPFLKNGAALAVQGVVVLSHDASHEVDGQVPLKLVTPTADQVLPV